MVLEERGILTVGMSTEVARKTLREHSDFRDKRSMVEQMLIEKGHIPCFLPKELNLSTVFYLGFLVWGGNCEVH